MSGYLAFLLSQTALAAACNAIHLATSRTARWLLLTHDGVDTDAFELKQEFLAAMIGVQRPTVSIAAGALQEAGSSPTGADGSRSSTARASRARRARATTEIRSEYSRLVPLG